MTCSHSHETQNYWSERVENGQMGPVAASSDHAHLCSLENFHFFFFIFSKTKNRISNSALQFIGRFQFSRRLDRWLMHQIDLFLIDLWNKMWRCDKAAGENPCFIHKHTPISLRFLCDRRIVEWNRTLRMRVHVAACASVRTWVAAFNFGKRKADVRVTYSRPQTIHFDIRFDRRITHVNFVDMVREL